MTAAEDTGAHIVVADDDPGIRGLISDFLSARGYQVAAAADARELDEALARQPADIVILDLMMPGEDGLSVCRRLARPNGPAIIILSAMGDETDRIVGLEVGAAHYVAKPCNPDELLARVRAVLRRRPGGAAVVATEPDHEFNGWRLALGRHELRAPDGSLVTLSAAQFALLKVFIERPGRILSRRQLLELSRADDDDLNERAIDVRVSRLRARLEVNGEPMISTLRGQGYQFLPKVSRAS